MGVYTTILNYIQQQKAETARDIKQSMVERIVQKCQETTSKLEDLVDRISREIVLDPELTAALERFAYFGEKMA